MAKLYFHYATMNAGKTTMLLQASYNYRERGMTTMLFVAGHYRKGDTGLISSRIGLETEAEMFRDGNDLFARVAEHHDHTTVHCVFVDEAQFLEEEQAWQLARIADRLDIPVMCYGLRTDFQGKLFSGSRALLAISDDLREVRTICRCGRKATMVVRLGADGKVARQGEQVAIGKVSMSRSAAATGKKKWAALRPTISSASLEARRVWGSMRRALGSRFYACRCPKPLRSFWRHALSLTSAISLSSVPSYDPGGGQNENSAIHRRLSVSAGFGRRNQERRQCAGAHRAW
jgi:thymidine kinase